MTHISTRLWHGIPRISAPLSSYLMRVPVYVPASMVRSEKNRYAPHPLGAAEIPRISAPAPRTESEPNEAPHCARAVIAAHFGLVAIPGENAIGVRVGEKGAFSAECSGGRHRGVSPSAGHGNGANIHVTGDGSDGRDCGDFCGYTASKWRQMASNRAISTYSSPIGKRLIASN